MVMIIVIASVMLLWLCACNKGDRNDITLKKGTRPDYPTLFDNDDLALVGAAIGGTADEEQKKAAVMALFDAANYSRQNTPLSLMLQNSDAGIQYGDVIMHGFNLKNGNNWYYQLATQVTSDSAFMETLMNEIAGLLKVAYTTGNGEYYYTVIKGSTPNCNCKIETFPYATFDMTQKPTLYNEQDFKTELHYLDSMHEINNMKFRAEIIADGSAITYNAEEHFYTVEFSVDMNADEQMLAEWFALPKEDMAVGGQNLKYYKYYNAVLEVWDNGYAKSFRSHSSREAGMGSGNPVDEFEYLWNENEILALLKEDESIQLHNMLYTVDDYIEYYSNPELVAAKLSTLKIVGIAVGSVVGVLIISIVIAVIVVETLLKQGKLPKLARKRRLKKQKKLSKKCKKRGAEFEPDFGFTDCTDENIE